MNDTQAIVGMAAVTFLVKAGLFLVGNRVRLPPVIADALDFVPAAVLTAITVPLVLAPRGGGLELTWRNPYLVAALVAILLAALGRNQLLTIILALAVFFAWRLAVLG